MAKVAWRVLAILWLWSLRVRGNTRRFLLDHGDALYARLVILAFGLLFVASWAAPQQITAQDMEKLRQQWELRQRSEFWSNIVELLLAGMLGWIVWFLRTYWIDVLKTFWKYLKVSFRVPIEIITMKAHQETTREELLNGQREIMARQTLLAARINILEDHGAVASFVADKNGAWTSITKEMADMIGDYPQRLIGYGWKIRIEEDDRERVMTAWLKAIKYGEPFSADLYFVGTTGTRRKVRMIAYQQLGPQGTPVGYVGQIFKIPGTGEVPPVEKRG